MHTFEPLIHIPCSRQFRNDFATMFNITAQRDYKILGEILWGRMKGLGKENSCWHPL